MEGFAAETSRKPDAGLLRIGIFTDTYAPQVNGISISLQLISGELTRRGHQVTVFAPRFPGYDDRDPGVIRLPSLKYMDRPPIYVAVLGTPRTTWSLTRKHFDILHAHSPLTVGLLAYVMASSSNLPLIYTYHTSIMDYTHYLKVVGGTDIIRRAARWFSTATTNLGDQIVVPSEKFRKLLLDQKVCRPIHTVPNGIDLNNFRLAGNPGSLRTRLGIPWDAPILLFVGRLDPEKHLDFLVDAFACGAEQHSDAHLVFVGDGSARIHIEDKVAGIKARERIHFLGMVNRVDLPELLHDSTVFLTASKSEVHPISVIEAIASGLPVVAVEDEAFEGMIEDGQNGYMVPRDVKVFSDTVFALLADREKLAKFSKHSTYLSENFSIEGQVKALEKLYFQAIRQNRHEWGSHELSDEYQADLSRISGVNENRA